MNRKPLPYENTTIPPERTQAEITGMLYAEGAEATRWTLTKEGHSELEFIFKVQGRPIAFRIVPALLTRPRHVQGRRGQTENMVDPAASMRLLRWWLKSQLEAIRYGLVSVEEAFLAHVAGRLPTGESVTIGDLILPMVRSGKALGPADLTKALGTGPVE